MGETGGKGDGGVVTNERGGAGQRRRQWECSQQAVSPGASPAATPSRAVGGGGTGAKSPSEGAPVRQSGHRRFADSGRRVRWHPHPNNIHCEPRMKLFTQFRSQPSRALQGGGGGRPTRWPTQVSAQADALPSQPPPSHRPSPHRHRHRYSAPAGRPAGGGATATATTTRGDPVEGQAVYSSIPVKRTTYMVPQARVAREALLTQPHPILALPCPPQPPAAPQRPSLPPPVWREARRESYTARLPCRQTASISQLKSGGSLPPSTVEHQPDQPRCARQD